MVKGTHAGLVSDRLNNPKFCGPADALTGIAPGWHPIIHNMGGMHAKLVPGMSLSGTESQMVHVYGGVSGRGIVQKGRYVRAGEILEVELWAKVRHHPVTVRVSLTPARSNALYDAADITIDAAYWKRYTARLNAPRDDREARFFITFVTNGQVLFDQVHLRPAGEGHVSEPMLETMRALRLPTVRFPGGSISSCYRWRHGTGPVHLRPSLPDPCFKWRIDYDFGIEDYLQMCLEQDIRPFVSVNIGSGTPAEAGELAAYCADWHRMQGVEPPEVYFMMGNEQYGAWEPSHMEADMYVEALREYVPLVRSNYPRARIVAMGAIECEGMDGRPATPLRHKLLEDGAGLFDVLTIHTYPGSGFDEPERQIARAAAGAASARSKLVQLIADCRDAGSDVKVAMTEWNFWTQATHWDGLGFFEPDDAAHGLFFSAMVHVFAGLAPDLELAHYYNLINVMGMLRNDGGHVSPTGVSGLYELYRPAFPGQVLPIAVDSPQLDDGSLQLDVLAVRTDEADFVFIANRSVRESVAVELAGMEGRPGSAALMLAADAASPFREEDAATASSSVGSAGTETLLPPLSVVRLRYERAGTTGEERL
ncbi:hypothetical protein [Paenibacillus flagellatus]|nr:hypothetical protein [Paenibacillus flagellatus]